MGLLSVIPHSFFLFDIQNLPSPLRERAGARGKEMHEIEIRRKDYPHPSFPGKREGKYRFYG